MVASKIKVGQFVMVNRPVLTPYGIIQGGTIGKVDAIRFSDVRVMVPDPQNPMVYQGVTIPASSLDWTSEKI